MITLIAAALLSSFSGAEDYAVAVLSPRTHNILATAFLIHEQAAMTAAHATGELGSMQPLRCGSNVVTGVVTRRSQILDLAIVEFSEPCGAPVVRLAPHDPAVGSNIVVVGFPGGRFLLLLPGTVSGYDTIQAEVVRYALLTNAQIFPGNSGGPAFDEAGAVVGVVTGRICFDDSTQPPQCYGSIVPISLMKIFLGAQ